MSDAAAGAPVDFASDNHAGAHPEVLDALVAANAGHAASYGADAITERAQELVAGHFGPESRAFFVFNGTGANVASVDSLTRPFEAVVCTDVAHMHVDECAAPERLAGVKLLTVAHRDGKLHADDLAFWDSRRGDEHQAQAQAVSITQSTELGTLYTLEETKAIADAAHERGMRVHIDGARLSNAAAALDASLAELTSEAGVDVVSFGGTKNGLVFGEAVVFCDPALAENFLYTRKQLGQLASKMRFIGAQFEALMSGDLWLENARHANAMADRLARGVEHIEGVEIAHPVEANAVFARLDPAVTERLMAAAPGDHPFYVWDADDGVVRWMCAWDTRPEDVDAFLEAIAGAIK